MRLTKRSFRTLALAVLALVGCLLVAAPTGPAQAVAAPTITFAPSGPLINGDTVTVSVTGFSPNAPVAIGECPSGRLVEGPGDCGRSADGASKLITVDGSGAGSATLTLRTGALNNATPPAATCDASHQCDFVATNIGETTQVARVTIPLGGPAMTFTPAGPFVDGDTVTVSVSGFAPSATIDVGECPSNRAIVGPGDCGPSASKRQALVVADGDGAGSAVLTIRVGSLGNATPPAATCGPSYACDFVATDIDAPTDQTRVGIPFVDGSDGGGGDSGVQGVTLSPHGPYKDGSKVHVVASGFAPNAPVAVAECGLRQITGPGDCGPWQTSAAQLTTADENGVARATLTLAYGPLHNAMAPAISCTVESLCLIVATNVANASQQSDAPVLFSGRLVRPAVSLTLSKSKVEHGKRVTFSGKVAPNAYGERVLLQRHEKRGWVTMKTAKVSSRSTYKVTWRPSSTKDYAWRVKIAKKSWHPSSTSKAKKLRVT